MKNVLSGIGYVFIFYLLQSSAFKGLSFVGAVPNLLLIACCSLGYLRGQRPAMLAGFFGGLLLDIFAMDVLGLNALFYLYIGFLCGMSNSIYDPREFRVPLLAIIFSDIALGLARFLFLYVMNGDFRFRYFFVMRMLPELAATLLLAFIIYPFMLWVEERFIRPDTDEKLKRAESDLAALADTEGGDQ